MDIDSDMAASMIWGSFSVGVLVMILLFGVCIKPLKPLTLETPKCRRALLGVGCPRSTPLSLAPTLRASSLKSEAFCPGDQSTSG